MINDRELENIKRKNREQVERIASDEDIKRGSYQHGEAIVLPSAEIVGDLTVRGTIRQFKAEYNSGRSVTGDMGIDHEGMNDTETWHSDSNESDSAEYYASLGMGIADNANNTPALILQTWKTPGSNLLLNGDFSSGDFTNWTKTKETNGTWSILPGGYGNGQDHAVFLVPGDDAYSAGELQSDNITINCGSYYLLQGHVKLSGSVAFLSVTLFYTVGGMTNGVYCFRGREGSYIQDYVRFSYIVYIPGSVSTTGTAYVRLTADTDTTGAAEFHFDELTLRYCEAASVHNFSAGDAYPRQFKAFLNQFTTPTITETLSTSQPYGVYFITDDAVDADGDEYTLEVLMDAGTWTLDVLGVKFASAGKADIYFDNTKLNVSAFDWYAASTTYVQHWTIPSFAVPTGGQHTIKIKVNGTNGSSGKYRLALTCLTARRTGG